MFRFEFAELCLVTILPPAALGIILVPVKALEAIRLFSGLDGLLWHEPTHWAFVGFDGLLCSLRGGE